MSILSTLAKALEHKPGKVEAEYDEAAQKLPLESLAEGITHAFQSHETPPFSQMVGELFNKSNPEQRSGLLEKLLSAAQGSGLSRLAGEGTLANIIKGFRETGQVTPEQTENLSAEEVTKLAGRVEKQNPSVVQQAGHFFSQHPGLFKTLGATALALVLSKVGRK